MRSLLSYLLVLSISFPSAVYAQVPPKAVVAAAEAAEGLIAKNLPKELEGIRAAQGIDEAGELAMRITDAEGKLVSILEFPHGSAEVIAASRPSSLLSSLKNVGLMSAAVGVHQLKRFPMEAFTFFIALGAVATQDLIFNERKNPGAYDELIEGQKDPISQLGFAAFMVANGVSTQPLATIFPSPRLHKFLPYLGMTVGMTASRVVSEIGHFPGLKDCAIKRDIKACDTAYDAWVKFNFKEKGLEMVPSLVGMIGSTFILGYAGQMAKLVMVAGKQSAIKVAKMIGVDMALAAAPGGFIVKGATTVVTWGVQIAELAGFIETSSWVEVPFTHFWNNYVNLGPKLSHERALLMGAATSGQIKGIDESLKKMPELMQKWRENNSMDVLTNHNKWSMYLGNFSAGYNISKRFYSDFLSDLWSYKYTPNSGEHPYILQKYPLYGVISAFEGKPVEPSKYLSLQDPTQSEQISVLNTKAQQMVHEINSHRGWYDRLPENERKLLMQIKDVFAGSDANAMAKTLILMNQILRLAPPNPGEPYPFYTESLSKYIKSLRDSIGNPTPFLEEGRGYLKALDEVYKSDGLVNPYPNEFGPAILATAPEALIVSMLNGPDIKNGGKVIGRFFKGFNSDFRPPRITSVGRILPLNSAPNPTIDPLNPPSIFNTKFMINDSKQIKPQVQTNLYKLLLDSPISSEILGDASGFKLTKWWTENVESQYILGWIDYEQKYQIIVQDLYRALWKDEVEHTNRSSFSTGIVAATQEEIELYLNVLGALAPTSSSDSNNVWPTVKDKIAEKVSKLISLLKEIKLTNLQGMNHAKEFQLVSRISNSELETVTSQYDKIVSDYVAYLQSRPTNRTEERQRVLATLKANLITAFEGLVTYGKIVNVVSYKERYADGTDAGSSCVKTQSGATTIETIQGRLECVGKSIMDQPQK